MKNLYKSVHVIVYFTTGSVITSTLDYDTISSVSSAVRSSTYSVLWNFANSGVLFTENEFMYNLETLL